MPDQPTDHEPKLLTLIEAAELLRAPVATLRYWRHLGSGPRSFRLGRRVVYRRDDLDAWIRAQHDRARTERQLPHGAATPPLSELEPKVSSATQDNAIGVKRGKPEYGPGSDEGWRR